jgi:hypothetical protein
MILVMEMSHQFLSCTTFVCSHMILVMKITNRGTQSLFYHTTHSYHCNRAFCFTLTTIRVTNTSATLRLHFIIATTPSTVHTEIVTTVIGMLNQDCIFSITTTRVATSTITVHTVIVTTVIGLQNYKHISPLLFLVLQL